MNFTPFPDIKTECLNLRQITAMDMNEFFILKSDERLIKNYGAKPKTYEEARRFLNKLIGEISRNECIVWGIADKTDNKLIGSICFWNICEEECKAEVGYELMYEWQGKGIMREALNAVIEYGFSVMGLELIEAFPDPDNARSVKLLERCNLLRGEEFEERADGKAFQRVLYYLNAPDALISE